MLEKNDFSAADKCFERLLDLDMENEDAYLGKLMASLKIKSEEDFGKVKIDFSNDKLPSVLKIFLEVPIAL